MGDWEESETEPISKIIPIPVRTSYIGCVPLLRRLYKREGKQFPLESLMCHAYQTRAHLLKFAQMMVGIFILRRDVPEPCLCNRG
jgi:hypothetical protein